MPLHPCFADKLHLLEGIVSIEARRRSDGLALENPVRWDGRVPRRDDPNA